MLVELVLVEDELEDVEVLICHGGVGAVEATLPLPVEPDAPLLTPALALYQLFRTERSSVPMSASDEAPTSTGPCAVGV